MFLSALTRPSYAETHPDWRNRGAVFHPLSKQRHQAEFIEQVNKLRLSGKGSRPSAEECAQMPSLHAALGEAHRQQGKYYVNGQWRQVVRNGGRLSTINPATGMPAASVPQWGGWAGPPGHPGGRPLTEAEKAGRFNTTQFVNAKPNQTGAL